MASVCFYFQVHQPCRLRRYSVFDSEPDYFDDARNRQILEKVAGKCYEPATELLLKPATFSSETNSRPSSESSPRRSATVLS